MPLRRLIHILLPAILISALAPSALMAQQFTVSSFRVLPDDVSGFISPVRDLNGDDCGLVKIVASDDFAFSTPLGIVKRADHKGEIWLYLPQGSKKITIKHAEWGVLRDYVFPTRIESRMAYELVIDEPARPAPPVVITDTVVTTLRDTLVLTRTDTIVMPPVRKPVPAELDVLATVAFGGRAKTLSAGVMIVALKRHGAFLHLSTDFGSTGPVAGECDRQGSIDGHIPFCTCHTRHSALMINAGAAHRLSSRVAIFEGIGYSRSTLAWQLAPSEGDGYVKNTYYSIAGISFEVGALLKFNRLTVAASILSIRGSDWYGSIGIGYRFGK